MKIFYNKKYIILLALFLCNNLKAQQDEHFSMYFFNPLNVNPGYAGSTQALDITVFARSQWVNFEGAPKTEALSIHSPLKNKNFGIGLTAINDELGATKNSKVNLCFAYSIRLNKKNHRLVLALKAGADFYRTNFSKLRVVDNTDNTYINNGQYASTLFNTGAGLYYYGSRFFLGASTPSFVKNIVLSSNSNTPLLQQESHYYLFMGFVFKLNASVNFRPSIIVKYVNNAPISADINASFLFYDKFWLGAMYRYNSSAGANVMYTINQKFKIGYAYDYTLNKIQNYSAGSHEVMLNFSLNTQSKGFKSPRYF